MDKIVNATDPKSMLKQLALEFIDGGRNARFEHWETFPFGGSVDVYGDIKTARSKDYYISTSAEMPTKCKFYNEITVSATCYANEDGETVFDCKIEELGLTKKQLAAFIKRVKVWSLDWK